MAVKIRLKKNGSKEEPLYRIVVADSRSRRDGRLIEELGYYNPMNKELKLDNEKGSGLGEEGSSAHRYCPCAA